MINDLPIKRLPYRFFAPNEILSVLAGTPLCRMLDSYYPESERHVQVKELLSNDKAHYLVSPAFSTDRFEASHWDLFTTRPLYNSRLFALASSLQSGSVVYLLESKTMGTIMESRTPRVLLADGRIIFDQLAELLVEEDEYLILESMVREEQVTATVVGKGVDSDIKEIGRAAAKRREQEKFQQLTKRLRGVFPSRAEVQRHLMQITQIARRDITDQRSKDASSARHTAE
jgi:hypothetical protein